MSSDCACVLGHARRSSCFQKQSAVAVPQVSASSQRRRRATAGLSPQGLGFSLPGSLHQCNILIPSSTIATYSFLHLLPTLFNLMDSQRRSKVLQTDSLRTPSFDNPSQLNNTNILMQTSEMTATPLHDDC